MGAYEIDKLYVCLWKMIDCLGAFENDYLYIYPHIYLVIHGELGQ